MRNFVSPGDKIKVAGAAGVAVTSGQLRVVGSLPVVAEGAAADGDPWVGRATGLFTLPWGGGNAQAALGGAAYITTAGGDADNHQVTPSSASGRRQVGVFAESVAQNAAPSTVRVRLDGVSRPAVA